jgi:hypothetical protein
MAQDMAPEVAAQAALMQLIFRKRITHSLSSPASAWPIT